MDTDEELKPSSSQQVTGKLPLVYSCSGCSSAAQLANALAVQLDRRGLAEMSCIAGVGGDVKPLVKLATSGRPIVAIDGCPLQCVRHTLARHNVVPAVQHTLSDQGVKKRAHVDFEATEVERLLQHISPTVPKVDAPPVDDAGTAAATSVEAAGSASALG